MIPPPAGFRHSVAQELLKAKRPAMAGRPVANQQVGG